MGTEDSGPVMPPAVPIGGSRFKRVALHSVGDTLRLGLYTIVRKPWKRDCDVKPNSL